MRLSYYIGKASLRGNPDLEKMLGELSAQSHEVFEYAPDGPEADVILSIGGDGTFLDAARIAVDSGIPVLGVNFGRMGFLSESKPDEVVAAFSGGDFKIEERTMLEVRTSNGERAIALNEVSVRRSGPAMLGVDVRAVGSNLPTYWGDGLLVSTSSGSTAYNLSVGGPICSPDTRVLIIAPIAPHNLNVRPLLVPENASVEMFMRSRDGRAELFADNRSMPLRPGVSLKISAYGKRLKMLRLGSSNFIKALRTRLMWGEDVRNF